MTAQEKKQLRILLIKYQLIYFTIVFFLAVFVVVGFSKIQYLIAESLFKTNVNELLVQDFRTVILNIDQFVPSQFATIELIKDEQVIFSIGERKTNFLIFKDTFFTKDQMALVFSSSYTLIIGIVGFFLVLSLIVSRFINNYFGDMYSKQLENQIKLKKSELLNELSKKVAHDIRSPLSTLNMLSAVIENAEVREMQTAVTKQIDRIANDLLNYAKGQSSENAQLPESLKKIVLQIKKEYDLKLLNTDCHIAFDDKLDCDIHLKGITLLYQNLNNFINNSIEAKARTIKVILEQDNRNVKLSIADDGLGMDSSTLKSIGKSIFSTKSLISTYLVNSGNGMALFNAKKDFAARGWVLDIQSQLGEGTTISVIIPNQTEM